MKNEVEITKLLILIGSQLSAKSKAELCDAFGRSAKLTKADAGRITKKMTEDELMKYIFGMSKDKLIDAIAAGAKITKADAGRALDATIQRIKKLKVVFGG